MLPLIFAVIAATVVPAPAASPSPAPAAASSSPSPTPLKEIGRVRAAPACAKTLIHANGAIASVLHNDVTMQRTINTLRHVDLDSNIIRRTRGLNEMIGYAVEMRREATDGQNETKQLREMMRLSPTRTAELKAFTDALDGALERQKKAAINLQSFATIVQGRAAREEANDDGIFGRERVNDGFNSTAGGDPALQRWTLEWDKAAFRSPVYTKTAREVADDFETRVGEIFADEGEAADHAPAAALLGC